jgi:formate dehydrogenase
VTAWLVEVLNAITGNVDKRGGLLFNPGIFDIDLLLWIATMGRRPRSYFGKAPYLTGSFPASELPREILMDNNDRVRALIVDAGNPALIFPNSQRTREALQKLDLLVSVDIYMNETAQMADFILPVAHYFEAEDLYITFPEHQPYPFGQWIPKVVEPLGESKPAWEIFHDLSRQMSLPILNQWPLELLFRAGGFIGSLFGKHGEYSFSPRNYYRLMCMGLCKLPFSRLMKSPHGASAGDIPRVCKGVGKDQTAGAHNRGFPPDPDHRRKDHVDKVYQSAGDQETDGKTI